MSAINWIRIVLLGGGLWLSSLSAGAQSGNPFELGDPSPTTPSATEVPAPPVSTNPFEVQAAETPAGVRPLPSITRPTGPTPTATDPGRHQTFVFGCFLALTLLLTLTVVLLRGYLRKSYEAFLNENLLSQLQREQGPIVSLPFQLLHVFFLLSGGFFLFLVLREQGWLLRQSAALTLLASIAAVGLVFAAKHLVLLALGYIFPLHKPLGRYAFTIVIFSIILGFALYPFSALLAFGPAGWQQPVIYASGIFLLAFYAFRTLRGLFIGTPYLVQHRFHFLLYLCSVEIVPVLLLLKALW